MSLDHSNDEKKDHEIRSVIIENIPPLSNDVGERNNDMDFGMAGEPGNSSLRIDKEVVNQGNEKIVDIEEE